MELERLDFVESIGPRCDAGLGSRTAHHGSWTRQNVFECVSPLQVDKEPRYDMLTSRYLRLGRRSPSTVSENQ